MGMGGRIDSDRPALPLRLAVFNPPLMLLLYVLESF